MLRSPHHGTVDNSCFVEHTDWLWQTDLNWLCQPMELTQRKVEICTALWTRKMNTDSKILWFPNSYIYHNLRPQSFEACVHIGAWLGLSEVSDIFTSSSLSFKAPHHTLCLELTETPISGLYWDILWKGAVEPAEPVTIQSPQSQPPKPVMDRHGHSWTLMDTSLGPVARPQRHN